MKELNRECVYKAGTIDINLALQYTTNRKICKIIRRLKQKEMII